MAKLEDLKREQFCLEYIIDLNATQAAIRAGYSENGARVQGSRLLADVNIQMRIAELMRERNERTEKTADEVVKELEYVGFSSIADYITWDDKGVKLRDSAELTPELKKAVEVMHESYDKNGNRHLRIKLHGKVQALELIGRHKNMWKDTKIGADGLNIVISDFSDDTFKKMLEANLISNNAPAEDSKAKTDKDAD